MTSRLIFRMTAPVVATSLLLLIVGVGAAWYVHHLQNRVANELQANVSSLRAAEELVIALHEIRTQLDHYLLTGDRKYLHAVPALRAKTERWLAEAERWGTAPEEREMMSQARKGQDLFFADLDRLMAISTASSNQKIKDLVDHVLVGELLEPTEKYLTLNAKESEGSMNENRIFTTRLVYVLLLLGTCGSGAGLIAGFGFARAFQRSLVQLSLPIRAAAGHLDEVVGPITFTASTELNELESMSRLIADRIGAVVERLRQSEREVLRAEQLAAVGQMAAGMAHELRNPLTSMKILVQAAMARSENREAKTEEDSDTSLAPRPSILAPHLSGRDLIVFDEEIKRLERLVQSFLEFAQPPQLERKSSDVKRLVEETVQLVGPRAALCNTRIDLALPASAVAATLDAAQFRQVLLNLLLNALDAVGSGGVIQVALEVPPDGWLSLRVSDTGCGLPASLGSRIFSPFVTTKETGLGLGLSISKRIVEAHGGEISATNGPEGAGAVFTIRLPGVPEVEPFVDSSR